MSDICGCEDIGEDTCQAVKWVTMEDLAEFSSVAPMLASKEQACETCLMWCEEPGLFSPRDGLCFLDEYNPAPCSAHYTCIHYQPQEAEDE